MKERSMQLLKNLINMPSVNNRDNELAKAQFIANYFAEHKISAKVQKVDDLRGNVTAWISGENKNVTMVWNGHIDTVPYGSLDDWKENPGIAIEKDGKVYGRGASDMQSGLAAMIYTLCHLEVKPTINIQFIGTCDEEKNGAGAEAILKQELMAKEPKLLLIGEPTGLSMGVAQKGCLWLGIEVIGKASHGAYPDEGINAIYEGTKIGNQIKDYVEQFSHPVLGGATAQITKIEGGIVANIIPDECQMVMDIRMVPPMEVTQILDFAKAKADKMAGEITFEILNDRKAIEIESDNTAVNILKGLVKEEGYKCENIGINYFTDASMLTRENDVDTLLFGPGEPTMCHKPNEYVDIKKYHTTIEVLTKFSKTYQP